MQNAATVAQVKFVISMLHKLVDVLLTTCYEDTVNNNNMPAVHNTLERIEDLCYDTGEAITVQECVDYLQNWASNLQNVRMLALLQCYCNTQDAYEAVMQNA